MALVTIDAKQSDKFPSDPMKPESVKCVLPKFLDVPENMPDNMLLQHRCLKRPYEWLEDLAEKA